MASWQTYVDNQICAQITCKAAVIAGVTDGSIWAKFEATPANAITQAELKNISDAMRNGKVSTFHENGIHIGGEKYVCLGVIDNKILRGRKGTSPMAVILNPTCMLAVTATDGFPPGSLNSVVEKLSDYLRQNNF